jgi:RimJ/RimL family protein N-acetyltransferase
MLSSKNVYLRLIEEHDLSTIVKWRNMPEAHDAFFNKFPLSEAGQKIFFTRLIEDERRKMFIICQNGTNKAIGTIGLFNIDFPNQSLEMGNVLIGDSNMRKKGYASEAIAIILKYCFDRLNINRIYVCLFNNNSVAKKVYSKMGFKAEGILRQSQFQNGSFQDTVIMAVLRSEYTADPAAL